MLDIIRARKIYLENRYKKYYEELKEFAKEHDSFENMDEETRFKYYTKLANVYVTGAQLSVCEDENVVGSDDVGVVIEHLIDYKNFFTETATCEKLPTLPDDPYAEFGKDASERLHRAMLSAMADECGSLLQLIEIMSNFEGVADENGRISIDTYLGVLNRSGMRVSKGELLAELAYEGLLDKDNKPTQKALDEGLFKFSESDEDK